MPKNAVGEPFSHSLFSGIEEVWIRGGGGGGRKYHKFLSKTFCLTMPKTFVGEPSVLCFRNIPAAKKFMDKKGGIKIFRRKFFVSQCRKNLWGIPLGCH